MFSGWSAEKNHDHLGTRDTESLLSPEHSHENLTQSTATLQRRHSLKFYLHIAAVVFYSILAVFFYSWHTRLIEKKYNCDATVFSPALAAVEYKTQTIVHNIAAHNKFRGPPRPEQDEAWASLLQYNNLRVQEDDLKKANLTSVRLNDEQGGYLASLDVFHTLHCVNKIRKSYYSDYYHDPNPLADQQKHFDHCIDLLRQVIMCHGDVSLHTYGWKDDYRWPWPTMQTNHQCRNWDKLMDWSKEHHIPTLQGPILTHPSLGTSYRGDEPHD